MALGLLMLVGCAAVKRDSYNVPKVLLPQRFLKTQSVTDSINSSEDARENALTTQPLGAMLPEWWLLLRSPELNALMDRVLANNSDLRVATLRMAQLQARMEVTGASRFPEVNLPVMVKSEAPTIIGSNTTGSPTVTRTYQASLRVDWRPDLWGEFASQLESSKLNLWRSTFLRDDLQRTVVASVVAAYVEYLSLNDRLHVAQETDIAVSEMLTSVATRLEVGDATAIDYEQQKAAVYQVRATIPVLQHQREVVFNRLSSFAGTMPSNLQLSDNGLDSIGFPAVLPGVPAALLLRRPDVRAVEAQLLAADADIDLARARILPPLDLTTQIGYGSNHLSDWFQPYNRAWNFIANLSGNLFDAGKRSKEVEFSRAIHEEMVETYLRVIYEGAREVDTSLSAIKMMETRMQLQRTSVDAAHQAWRYSQEAYNAGAVDYLVVLDSERTYTRNLDEWINARLQRYQGLASLFSALGGGVAPGITLPGQGERPLQLKSEIEYGSLLKTLGDPAAVLTSTRSDSTVATNEPQTLIKFTPVGQAEGGALVLSLTPTLRLRAPVSGIDWLEDIWLEPGEHWLVEITGLYERTAIAPAWRDLHERFKSQVMDRILVPRRQGLVMNDVKERASWYHLYVAHNPSRDAARQLCADLQAKQQRCRIFQVRQPDNENNERREPVLIEDKADIAQPIAEKPAVY